jgi:uncharacterized coiled-coil protein SlyX
VSNDRRSKVEVLVSFGEGRVPVAKIGDSPVFLLGDGRFTVTVVGDFDTDLGMSAGHDREERRIDFQAASLQELEEKVAGLSRRRPRIDVAVRFLSRNFGDEDSIGQTVILVSLDPRGNGSRVRYAERPGAAPEYAYAGRIVAADDPVCAELESLNARGVELRAELEQLEQKYDELYDAAGFEVPSRVTASTVAQEEKKLRDALIAAGAKPVDSTQGKAKKPRKARARRG